jgi:hypothetical protein
MRPTLQKILARFDGDRNKAVAYCEDMAYFYPRLRVEYRMYRDALLEAR